VETTDKAWHVDLGVFIALLIFFIIAYWLGQTITPFIAAGLFAYILNPAVNAMSRRGVPRGLSVAVFVVLFFIAILAVVAGAVYIVQKEVRVLIDGLPGYIQTIETEYMPVVRERLDLGEEVNLPAFLEQAKERLAHLSPESVSSAAGYVFKLLSGAVGFFLAVLNLFLIPVIMAYLLFDFERMKSAFLGYLPTGYKANILSKMGEVETVLKDFVKGQLMVSVIMGVLYSIGLWGVGVDMPFLLGMGSGLLNLVPYLGTALGILASAVLALLKFHDLIHPALVLSVFIIVQTLEAYVITPRVVGGKLGLHPVVIILSLVVFGEMLGFVGILIAVPVAAVLKVFIAGFLRDYKASGLFAGD
jgi:predicted PurR-regulated permease PerM